MLAENFNSTPADSSKALKMSCGHNDGLVRFDEASDNCDGITRASFVISLVSELINLAIISAEAAATALVTFMDGENVPRPAAALRLDDCIVLAQRNLIIANGEKATVEPKIMDVLCVLADKPGEVFSREELADRVWGSGGGSDERLTRAISQLRKVMGDSSRTPRYIETVSKRGYRLVSPVVHEAAENGVHPSSASSANEPAPPGLNNDTMIDRTLQARPWLPLATAFLLGIVLGLFGALALMLFGL